MKIQPFSPVFISMMMVSSFIAAQNQQAISTCDVCLSVYEKGLMHTELDFYAGTLLLHRIGEFSLLEGYDTLLQRVIGYYEKFGNGEISASGNFISYEAGGSGAAFLAWKGVTTKLDRQVETTAAKMMSRQKRAPEGIMTAKFAHDDMVFIDMTFAITPYLLYTGLKFDQQAYVDLAVDETLELFRILRDEKTGLVHQARGFLGLGSLTEDNWSRGNGWGAFALAILARDIPESHPKRKEVFELSKQFFTSVLKYQNDEGLWHQEMTDPGSYVETSGSGLLLYGLGLMIENELLDQKYLANFELGLKGLTSYIGSDGSVSHACFSCLAPGNGTKDDYKNKAWVYNDQHAFGPVVLAFGQAAKMGVDSITPLKKLGYYTIADAPEQVRTYVTYARGSDIAWENDRVAYRVFGPSVRDKVKNGVDVWAKSVDYPILDKWCQLNAQGKDYHRDRGEGCDFYHMGKWLGCGALAIWIDGKAYASEPFDSYHITKNQDDQISFDLEYNTWNVPNLKITEKKTISMGLGNNLFKVTSILESEEERELTVAIGLSTFGNQQIKKDRKNAFLSVWEQIDPVHGTLGSGLIVNPENLLGFASSEGDKYILIKVKTNTPFSYYAGAGWDKSKYFPQKKDWEKYIKSEAKSTKF